MEGKVEVVWKWKFRKLTSWAEKCDPGGNAWRKKLKFNSSAEVLARFGREWQELPPLTDPECDDYRIHIKYNYWLKNKWKKFPRFRTRQLLHFALGLEQDSGGYPWGRGISHPRGSLSRRIVPWRCAVTMHSANEDQPQTGILSAASGTQGSQQRRSRDWQVHSCSFSLTCGRLIGFWKWWRISKSKCVALAVFNGRVNSRGYVPGQSYSYLTLARGGGRWPLHFHLCHKRDRLSQMPLRILNRITTSSLRLLVTLVRMCDIWSGWMGDLKLRGDFYSFMCRPLISTYAVLFQERIGLFKKKAHFREKELVWHLMAALSDAWQSPHQNLRRCPIIPIVQKFVNALKQQPTPYPMDEWDYECMFVFVQIVSECCAGNGGSVTSCPAFGDSSLGRASGIQQSDLRF